jgi:DNA topoisomerase I
LDLFKLPRIAGEFEGKEMKVAIGRFGPYILHESKFYSIPKTDDPYTIEQDRAITIIQDKRIAEANKIIKKFDGDVDIQVLNGRYGPYITSEKLNYKIPKGTDPASLTLEACQKIIAEAKANPAPKKPFRRFKK